MNKQEIIDKLRLEISERDMLLIDMQAKQRNAIKLLKLANLQIEIACKKIANMPVEPERLPVVSVQQCINEALSELSV